MEINFFSSDNRGQKVGGKFIKLRKIGFSMECFTADFLQFFTKKSSNFGFWMDGWVLTIKSKHFGDQRQKSSENVKSRGLDRVRKENLFLQTILDKKFQQQRSSENGKSRDSDQIRNENLYPQTVLDKSLVTNLQNWAKRVSLWNFLKLIFLHFLPKYLQTWILGGRLGTRYQIQNLEYFLEGYSISEDPRS